MSVVQLELPDAVLARAREIAEEQQLPLDRVVAEAVEQMIAARDELAYLRRRAERGRNVDVKALLRKAPDVEPDPSDRIEQ